MSRNLDNSLVGKEDKVMLRSFISKGKLSVRRFAAIALAMTTAHATAATAEKPVFSVGQPPGDNNVQLVSSVLSKQDNMALPRPATLSEIVYNVNTPPNWQQSEGLQGIVDEVVDMADNKKLPLKPLSITLVNVRTGEIAGYRQGDRRYPASVVKLFWLPIVYAQIEANLLNEEDLNLYISKMIKNSDNNAASFLLDKITDTRSRPKLSKKEFETWLNKRNFVNRFFRAAGYSLLNIHQKTFPVYSIKLRNPRGTDLQMRGNPKAPIRNKITTYHSARLLYEICVTGQAVSPEASQKMSDLLERDLNPQVWKKQRSGFNPIRGFLGEGLADTGVEFYSKAGWAGGTRTDVAFVKSRDGETAYILAVFGDSRAYARDWKIFPKMSRLVFDRVRRL